MADIELVIKIDESEYINIKNAINSLIENGVERASMSKVCLAILDGTPLPKGHGRLIDADELKEYEQRWSCDYESDGYSHVVEIKDIDDAPTVIEANKEVKE